MRLASSLAFLFIAALSASALAQAPPAGPPTRVRGTVETFADHTLTVKTREGGTVSIGLAPDFTVRAVVAQTLADIKPGDKVGITSVKGVDGTQQAVAITIFPASMTNIPMRQLPWDLVPGSLMTNAPVVEARSTGPGQMLKVTVNGKEAAFAVPSGTPIVTYGPGDPSLLKPGAAVFVFARKQPDGSLIAPGVTAEKNGVKPPM
jgi:hypothetical protein